MPARDDRIHLPCVFLLRLGHVLTKPKADVRTAFLFGVCIFERDSLSAFLRERLYSLSDGCSRKLMRVMSKRKLERPRANTQSASICVEGRESTSAAEASQDICGIS